MQDHKSAFGPFLLDHTRRWLTRNDQPIPINNHGYTILATLLEAQGEPVSKHTLMERIWPNTVVEEGNLTVQISHLRRQLGEDADALLLTVPRIGYRLAVPASSSNDAAKLAFPLIAVLPFANHGDLQQDGYFVDGVVEDIIMALSRFKSFAVVSRGSTFTLRDRSQDAVAGAAGLGAQYALAGSIRRMGDQLRVNAQLVEVPSGKSLWAERYQGSSADVFSFQDRITASVAGIVEPKVRQAEIERVRRKPTDRLDAYEFYLRALPLFQEPGHERHGEAIMFLRSSMELDPSFALPRAYSAWIYERRISLRESPLGNNDRDVAIELARSALALGGEDAVVRVMCAWVLFRLADDLTAVQAVRRAAADNPNNVLVLHLASAVLGLYGAADETYTLNVRAYELSPGSPEAYLFLQSIGAAELMRGNNEAAVDWCFKSLATFNDWLFTYITLVAAYYNLGRMDEARAMLRRVRELSPNLTMKTVEDNVAQYDAYADAVIPALREAGLPER
ncbi:MAG TPA: winged helix-turn-helix domain-containing protein [Devosia sp.]